MGSRRREFRTGEGCDACFALTARDCPLPLRLFRRFVDTDVVERDALQREARAPVRCRRLVDERPGNAKRGEQENDDQEKLAGHAAFHASGWWNASS